MSNKYAPNCEAASLASLKPISLERLLKCLSASELAETKNDWLFWARVDQKPPGGDWRTWMFLGGRGAGKTRAGAEWVSLLVRTRTAGRIALIGPTFHDVREIMVEAGVRQAAAGPRPTYEATRRRLVWPNGAQAYCFSAEDPESLRGPQFDAAWCDELAYWSAPERALDTLAHGLRIGQRPRMMVTTTPRPIPAVKRLVKAEDTEITRATTWDNHTNLSRGFIVGLGANWTGSARERQELFGDLVEDHTGAMWRRTALEAARDDEARAFERVIVAVDPPAGMGPGADACGIIAAGRYEANGITHAVVLADASVQGLAPAAWAERAVELARSLEADCIVAEANNGGEMVRTLLRIAAPEMPVRLVYATRDKVRRAGPVSALYDRGLVKHRATFAQLEDQMCAFGGPESKGSPDRVDALVWALTDLLIARSDPNVRVL